MRMASATANCAKIAEYVFTRGYDNVVNYQMGPKTKNPREFQSFEEVFEAWVAQMRALFGTLVRSVNHGRTIGHTLTPRPYLSSISSRSIESGPRRERSLHLARKCLDHRFHLGGERRRPGRREKACVR